ncbi:RING-H2 finger protein ATL32 [Linum grandiflorum]
MITTGINLVMTLIGFAVSTMFIVFVCTRLVCARIHLNAARRSFPIASRSDLGILERGYHGLDSIVVANFPTKEYNNELFSAKEDAQCTVCLAEYHQGEMLRILPYCGHSFHVTCIDLWLQQHATCPICRISLHEFPDRKRALQPVFSSAIRSQEGVEDLSLHSYNCLYAGHVFPPRPNGSNAPEPNNDGSRRVSDCSEEPKTGESLSPLVEENCRSKEVGNKQMESPSNPQQS